jgi:hypothetical protein
MIKRFLFSILFLLLITMIVGVFHYLIIKNLSLFIPLINIYLFNFLMTVMGLAILYLIYDKFNDKVGFTFLAIGIIKMAIAVSFLMPLIKSNFSNKIPDTLNFFFCYFIFLIIESVFMVKLLNKKQ